MSEAKAQASESTSESTSASADTWLLPLNTGVGKVRLICFPHAGGSATSFTPLATALEPHFSVMAAQLPGRFSRLEEPAWTDVSSLARALATALASHVEPPFAFYGHSFGGRLAFEVARCLRSDGATLPFHMVVAASPAPHLSASLGLHELSNDRLLAEIGKWGGLPPALLRSQELQELVLPSFRADLKASDEYTFVDEAPLEVPITAVAGAHDPMVYERHMSAWERHSSSRFRLQVLDAGHFFTGPSAHAFEQLLQDALVEM